MVVFVCDRATAGGRRQRSRVFGGTPTRGCLVNDIVVACVESGWSAVHDGAAWPASLRGRSPNGTRAKAKNKGDKCYKTVQNARGDANCSRAQEGGGRGETLVLLSVVSSRAMRVQTARSRSPRRRCSFLVAAAPERRQNVQIRRSS